MKIESAKFAASALELDECPASARPEFAFVGRSNVGKSSLINMLTGVKGLAMTSSKPGKTRRINFFNIDDSWRLVDLPGYGYAKVAKSDMASFNVHVSAYLIEREQLKHIFVLVDSQLEPQEGDLAFAHWLQECKLPFSVIFTKTDKISGNKLSANAQLFVNELESYAINPTELFSCSSKTKFGRAEILKFIDQFRPKKSAKKKTKVQLGWMGKR